MTGLAERLVNRLATRGSSRRGFLAAATLGGTALAVDPIGFLTRPQSAYASVCGPDASCGGGYTVFCCTIHDGKNTCPPGTFAGGWWKADRSSFCGGQARYYIDCNAKPGTHFHCHCNDKTCDQRFVACNVFRYGQCNTQIAQTTAVVCRQISCLPPWQLYPGECGRSSATDNNTARHNAPCLTKKNTYPDLVTYDRAPHVLHSGKSLDIGDRLVAPDRHTELTLRDDGNLVLHNQDGVQWSTETGGRARGGSVVLREFGELVVLGRRGKVVWTSKPRAPHQRLTYLKVFDDGRLAICHDGHVLWHTDTHTP